MEKEGLINPINIGWHLDTSKVNKFEILIGNDRIVIAKELGWKKISAYLTVFAYEGNYPIVNLLKEYLPFVREKRFEGPSRAVEYKAWEGDKILYGDFNWQGVY